MKYELLGPLRVVRTDGAAFISAPKVEILLGTLLTQADHVVTADQLMAEIWGERLPRRATAGLHVYISELRKFLHCPEREQGPIVTRSAGYVLHLGSDQFDAQQFLALTELGRAEMREQRYEDAFGYFERALELWRGQVLGGVGTGPILLGYATRLAEARMECTEMLIECQVQLGRHRQVVGMLYTLTTENPLHEAFYRQLMLALYRSERRADALLVYQSARKVLREELGLEPCTALQTLHQSILRCNDDQLLDARAAA